MKKIALITGASRGIGRALAEVFAQHGYSLLLIARSESELIGLQQDLKNRYQCVSKILSVDLAKFDSVDVMMSAFLEDLQYVEVLVNNAGFGIAGKLTEMAQEDICGQLEVNMGALTKLTYAVLPYMVTQGRGRVLNVASTAAFAPGPYMSIYYATKAYVLSFSEGVREEYRKDGITVSVLCPGVTLTGFQERAGLEKTLLMSGLVPSMTAEKVARLAYKGLSRGRRVIIPGVTNKLAVFLMWLFPRFIVAKVTGMLEKPKL